MSDAFHKILWKKGPLSFPLVPIDDKWARKSNPEREFKEWHQVYKQKNGSPCVYQGEMIKNARDGKGIMVCQGSYMMIGHFKNG